MCLYWECGLCRQLRGVLWMSGSVELCVAYVVMLVVGMVPVGRRDVGAAVFGMAAAAYGPGGRLGGRLGSPLVVRGCIPPMK